MSPSIWQILIIVAIVVLLFGSKRIPELGKSLGEAIRGFKKGINDDTLDVTESSQQANRERIEQEKGTQQGQTQKESEKQNS